MVAGGKIFLSAFTIQDSFDSVEIRSTSKSGWIFCAVVGTVGCGTAGPCEAPQRGAAAGRQRRVGLLAGPCEV